MEYSLPQTQSLIESSQLTEVPCFTSLPRDDLTPLDFRVDKSELCIDPTNIYLYTKCEIVKTTEEAVEVFPANNIGYSMFQTVEMLINDQKITQDHVLYQWLSYITCLTQFSKQYRKTVLQTSLWYADLFGTMDTATSDNEGAVKRQQKTTKAFELYSKVLTDHVQLPRLLPPQTELLYRFTPAPPMSFMMATKGTFKLRILDARLYVAKVKLTAPLPKQLYYPVSRFHSRSKTVNAGEQNVNWVPFSGKCPRPRRLYLIQVSQKAFNGDITKNPFNLQTFKLRQIQVYFNELSLPVNTAMSFGDEDIARCYFNSTKAVNNPAAWTITTDAYAKGYFVYVVDLTSDQNANGEYISTPKTGSVRVSIDYKTALNEPIVIMCFAEYDDVLRIDDFGNPTWNA